MKHLYLSLLCAMVTISAQSQTSWKYLGDYNEYKGMLNASTFAYIQSNQLHITTDSGNTSTTSNLDVGLFKTGGAVYFLDDQKLFTSVSSYNTSTGNNTLQFWKSTDGGATFTGPTVMTPIDEYIAAGTTFELYFFNDQVGLAYGRTLDTNNNVADIMIRTTDGGDNWSLINLDAKHTYGAEDITYNKNGLVRIYGDQFSTLCESTDYGATWTTTKTNPLDVEAEFADDGGDNIWGVGYAGAGSDCYVKSTDGGETFSSWNIPDEDNGGIDGCSSFNGGSFKIEYFSSNQLVVHGDRDGDPVSIYSADGGDTWSDLTIPGDPYLGIHFLTRSSDETTAITWGSNGDLLVLELGTPQPNSIDELVKPTWSLFPNPATDVLQFTEPIQGAVTLFDIHGSVVLKQSMDGTNTLSLHGLAPGYYVVQHGLHRAPFIKN